MARGQNKIDVTTTKQQQQQQKECCPWHSTIVPTKEINQK